MADVYYAKPTFPGITNRTQNSLGRYISDYFYPQNMFLYTCDKIYYYKISVQDVYFEQKQPRKLFNK